MTKYAIGTTTDYGHLTDTWTHLGQKGVNAMYQCPGCERRGRYLRF